MMCRACLKESDESAKSPIGRLCPECYAEYEAAQEDEHEDDRIFKERKET
jgi:CRISPR/Cas system-associated protein Cas10 (large subunit of type III CRISPR-Cas system)